MYIYIYIYIVVLLRSYVYGIYVCRYYVGIVGNLLEARLYNDCDSNTRLVYGLSSDYLQRISEAASNSTSYYYSYYVLLLIVATPLTLTVIFSQPCIGSLSGWSKAWARIINASVVSWWCCSLVVCLVLDVPSATRRSTPAPPRPPVSCQHVPASIPSCCYCLVLLMYTVNSTVNSYYYY